MYGGVVAPYQYAWMVQILCFVQASTATGWLHPRTELDGDFSKFLGWLSSHWPQPSSVWYWLQPWSMRPLLCPWRWGQRTKQKTLHGFVLADCNWTHGNWSNQWHIVSCLCFSIFTACSKTCLSICYRYMPLYFPTTIFIPGIPSQRDGCSLAYPATCTIKTGQSMTYWESSQSKQLMRLKQEYVFLRSIIKIYPLVNKHRPWK